MCPRCFSLFKRPSIVVVEKDSSTSPEGYWQCVIILKWLIPCFCSICNRRMTFDASVRVSIKRNMVAGRCVQTGAICLAACTQLTSCSSVSPGWLPSRLRAAVPESGCSKRPGSCSSLIARKGSFSKQLLLIGEKPTPYCRPTDFSVAVCNSILEAAKEVRPLTSSPTTREDALETLKHAGQ
jgi:hypothetical protein